MEAIGAPRLCSKTNQMVRLRRSAPLAALGELSTVRSCNSAINTASDSEAWDILLLLPNFLNCLYHPSFAHGLARGSLSFHGSGRVLLGCPCFLTQIRPQLRIVPSTSSLLPHFPDSVYCYSGLPASIPKNSSPPLGVFLKPTTKKLFYF